MPFRLLTGQYFHAEITLMEVNPTYDLIAMATVSGEVQLRRFSLKIVWTIPTLSTEEVTVLVSALAWRPDGKLLAYGYDNGKVTLCDVENSQAVHFLDMFSAVTCLTWIQFLNPPDAMGPSYTDRSEEFLMEDYEFISMGHSSTSKRIEKVVDFKKIKGQKNLNILAIGMKNGRVHLSSFGVFPTGFIDADLDSGDSLNDRVISVTISRDSRKLTVVLETGDAYYYRSYHMSLLYSYKTEIEFEALKYGQISSLLDYISPTIGNISNAWEDILLELDTKLHDYGRQKNSLSEGTIGDDFLELLMFGNPSDSLEKFLLHDLTKSGLRDFASSLEHSYFNILQLVLHLQRATSSLFYHLNDFGGMAMMKERFSALYLRKSETDTAILTVGSFLLKATEIQQVIEISKKNFRAFCRWLFSVIIRMLDEPLPLDVSKVTQQDLEFVSEFIKDNFTIEYDENQKKFVKLERVNQYLKKEDLPYPASTEGNPWIKFLKDNPSLKESGFIFPHHPKKSLVTLYDELYHAVTFAVFGPGPLLDDSSQLSIHYLLNAKSTRPKISHIGCSKTGCVYTAITEHSPPCTHFYLLKDNFAKLLEAVCVRFPVEYGFYKILDIKFYNIDTITVLLMENFEAKVNCPILVQLPMKPLVFQLTPIATVRPTEQLGPHIPIPILDGTQFVEVGNHMRMTNMQASQIAVNNFRKVVCVLSSSNKEVRVYTVNGDNGQDDEEV